MSTPTDDILHARLLLVPKHMSPGLETGCVTDLYNLRASTALAFVWNAPYCPPPPAPLFHLGEFSAFLVNVAVSSPFRAPCVLQPVIGTHGWAFKLYFGTYGVSTGFRK